MKRQSLSEKVRAALSDPTWVMALVALMYVLKSTVKITLGGSINSPMISGDGFHNLADLFEAGAVIAVIFVAKRPSSEKYPFGRKNIEFFTSLAIGAGLIFMSLNFALRSMVGLLSMTPVLDSAVRSVLPLPAHEDLVMDSSTFPWVLAVTAGSVILSFLVGRYQIAVGKASGHASLVADGEETLSDGTIESVTVAGVLGEYIFHAPWLEYPLGLLVAVLIARTGRQLFVSAWRVLLQHSIGIKEDAIIRDLAEHVPGVVKVTDLKTFQVGHIAVCMITVTTRAGATTIPHVKYAIEHALEKFLLGLDFKECEIHIRIERPEPMHKRVAFAVIKEGEALVISPTLERSTHLIVCDTEDGAIVRSKEEPAPTDPVMLLIEKRVEEIYVFDPARVDRNWLEAAGIAVTGSTSYLPSVMGVTE